MHDELLEFAHITGSHCGRNLAAIVEKVIKKFRLRKKLISITTDNASNNTTLYKAM